MFSRRSAGDFDQTRSLGSGRPGLVPPLTLPVCVKREDTYIRKLLVDPSWKIFICMKRCKLIIFQFDTEQLLSKHLQVGLKPPFCM